MEKLSWDEIKRRYPDEHVELIDYEWDETEPYPVAGVVRTHSKDHKEFWRLLKAVGQLDSAIIFTGPLFRKRAPNSYPCVSRQVVLHPIADQKS